MTANRSVVRRLLGIIFLDQTCLTITFPLLALIFFDPNSRLFDAGIPYTERSIWYGICIGLPNFINLFFAPVLSGLSDVIGRKKILIVEIGSAAFFMCFVGVGVYLGKLWLVLCGFVVKGAFSRANPTALAIIGDAVSKQAKVVYMGYLQFAISVGAAVGPFVGGYLASRYFFTSLNFSFPFFVGALLALVNLVIVIRRMPETHQIEAAHADKSMEFNLKAFTTVFFHPNVLRVSLILLMIQLSWSTYYQFIPAILKIQYAYQASELGNFIAMIAFWLAITTGIGIKVLHRFLKPQQMLILAALLVIFGILCTFFICLWHGSDVWLWLSAAPVAAGDVIAYTCLTAFYSNSMPLTKQGKVMGMSFIIVASCWSVTGVIGGYLLSLQPLLPLAIAPIFALGALALLNMDFGRKLVPSLT